MDTKILRNISYGVYLVSSNSEGVDAGTYKPGRLMFK